MTNGFTVWFTGLSGAGKTTLADGLERELLRRGRLVETLDGDVVRAHLTKGLGFSKADRDENIRRIGWVAAMGTRLGGTMLVSAISPYAELRREVRARIGDFIEVYVKCSLDELIRRDPKGLYRKALAGEIANFTGVSDPYEEPQNPEITVETDRESVETSLAAIVDGLEALGYLSPASSEAARHAASAAVSATSGAGGT